MKNTTPLGDEEGKYSKKFIEGLFKSRKEIKAGKLIPHFEMKKQLGL
ncbi:hypothetical protein HY989_06450 [Candidatus Micrarchaeota archaeon]|nr:hypothetical protein [Candidatus Micrarchaeota archaeon]